MFAALTATGLSAAAGLNPWIPFLTVALAARFTSLVELPGDYAWIQSWWAIGAGVVLLLSEVFLDKIAVIDHINDGIGTFVRPMIGGLIFVATTAAERFEQSEWVQSNPWVPWAVGVVVAGVVHGTKAAVRPVVNTASVGLGTPVVSAGEDVASFGASLLAVLAPVLVVLVVIPAIVAAVWFAVRHRTRRRSP